MQIPEADIFANEQGNVRGVLNMEAETSQPNSNVESLFPVSGPPKEVSFDTVPFLDNSSEFDRKYSLNGRYGFELDSSPDVSKPGNQSSAPTLLQVGKAAASAIEGEMDLGIDLFLVNSVRLTPEQQTKQTMTPRPDLRSFHKTFMKTPARKCPSKQAAKGNAVLPISKNTQ